MTWYEALANALAKGDMPVMQIATLEGLNRPRVRSHIHRSMLTASSLPTLPLLITTTDMRACKVAQLAAASDPLVEAVYWAPSANEQFRILGRASIVPPPGWRGAYPARRGVVCAALDKEGFDWEAKRLATFNELGAHTRATFARPEPGTPTREEEMREWPETLPRWEEATGGERAVVARALGQLGLVVIEAFEVDYLAFGVPGGRTDRRTRYERDWEDEASVVFRETLVVP